MSELTEQCPTTDDDDLPLSITHSRDMIIFGGKLEQDYHFLIYRFHSSNGDVLARMYLDDIQQVSVFPAVKDGAIDDPIMAYLQKRFNRIKKLGGPKGYTLIWEKSAAP